MIARMHIKMRTSSALMEVLIGCECENLDGERLALPRVWTRSAHEMMEGTGVRYTVRGTN
jgi:hypothetical protein